MSTHKTMNNKAPDQILPYSDNTLFRSKAANSGQSQAAFIQIIPQGGLPRGRGDKSSRAEFQNSMCDIVLFFNKMVFRAVWLSSSRVTRICCLISEKRIVRIR